MPDRAREVRLKEANVSAQALRVQLQVVEALGPADLDRAFLDISAKGASALVVLTRPPQSRTSRVTRRPVSRQQRFDRIGRDRDFRFWHFSDVAFAPGDVRS